MKKKIKKTITHRSIPAAALSNPVFKARVVSSRKRYSRKRLDDFHTAREWAV